LPNSPDDVWEINQAKSENSGIRGTTFHSDFGTKIGLENLIVAARLEPFPEGDDGTIRHDGTTAIPTSEVDAISKPEAAEGRLFLLSAVSG
jgi:hypothetical protein